MYTIQKYLETSIAAWFFCFPLTHFLGRWEGRVQRWALFFKAEEYPCFPASPGSNVTGARKGLRALGEPALFADEIGRWGKAGHGEQRLS